MSRHIVRKHTRVLEEHEQQNLKKKRSVPRQNVRMHGARPVLQMQTKAAVPAPVTPAPWADVQEATHKENGRSGDAGPQAQGFLLAGPWLLTGKLR